MNALLGQLPWQLTVWLHVGMAGIKAKAPVWGSA